MICKVVITGTESTGKTTLAGQLATHFNASLVPDVSRRYIASLQRPYTRHDVVHIAEQIIQEERELYRQTDRLLVSDNDLINIKIWLQYYGWEVPRWLTDTIAQHPPQLYLLTYIDVPWQADEQRANPHDRHLLYQLFVAELEALAAPFQLIRGNEAERLQQAIDRIAPLL